MKHDRRAKLFRLHQDFQFYTHLRGIEFENEFIRIRNNGHATLYEGCLSDGCSPTKRIKTWFQFGWVLGPPNGPPHPEHPHLPISFKAFFFHDMLLDYCRDVVPMDDIHKLFCIEIHKTDWRLGDAACWLVKKFGPKR